MRHSPIVIVTFIAVVLLGGNVAAREPVYPIVREGHTLVFPRDHGAHPEFRTEWWYITAWLKDERGREFGAQITFFRHRSGVQEDNPSRFAPTQLLFAHAAVTDLKAGRLLHDQRAGRAGFGVNEAREGDTDVRLEGWRLLRQNDRYVATLKATRFEFDLRFQPTQPVLLQGRSGFSQKGPAVTQASYYYSRPQLAASGRVTVDGQPYSVTGTAWLDHEWSSEIMAAQAVGWDWAGINLADGGALMAFRLRDVDGNAVWSSATLRERDGSVQTFGPEQVEFIPLRQWLSGRTGATYPIHIKLRVAEHIIDLLPALDDQELDARNSTGTVYWEGAVRARKNGRNVGQGYLELTGYWKKLKL